MADETSVDELIRFLQAELENAADIDDAETRENRQWQIESAIQESLAFLNEVKEIKSKGNAVFQTDESVRVIARSVNITKTEDTPSMQHEDMEEVFCRHCDEDLTEDLSFCPSCGKYQ